MTSAPKRPPIPLGTTQLGLFTSDEMMVDPTFAAAHRIQLDATSWVEHIPGWLIGSEQLLAALVTSAGWEQRDRWMVNRMVVEPRLTAEYTDLADAPEPMLHTAAAALSNHYGVPYDGLWLNFYRDHRDSTGWHGDWPTCKRDECIVPVLSLGATRRFLLKPRQGGRSIVLTPAGGDLIVMGGRCQRDWRHSVPKQAAPAGARVSVNFSSRRQATRPPRPPSPTCANDPTSPGLE
jgi:2OG-Fe(II) oxygenase superfamily